jgi:hypothetical protein
MVVFQIKLALEGCSNEEVQMVLAVEMEHRWPVIRQVAVWRCGGLRVEISVVLENHSTIMLLEAGPVVNPSNSW